MYFASLMPASGHQDHTTSPSASVPFVIGPSASTASRSNVRDDREPPLPGERDGAHRPLIWVAWKAEYFCQRGWTGKQPSEVICPSGKQLGCRKSECAAAGNVFSKRDLIAEVSVRV